jgi:hypothetical protein
MSNMYILDGKTPVREPDIVAWGRWKATNNAERVALTEQDGVTISTVFLGIDHNFFGGGAPILFETMVFGGPMDGDMRRYSTWDEAELGHAAIVALAKIATLESVRKDRLQETIANRNEEPKS